MLRIWMLLLLLFAAFVVACLVSVFSPALQRRHGLVSELYYNICWCAILIFDALCNADPIKVQTCVFPVLLLNADYSRSR